MPPRRSTERVECLYTDCTKDFADKKAMNKHMEEYHKVMKKWCPIENCAPRYSSKRRWRVVNHLRTAHNMSGEDASELGRAIEKSIPYETDPQQIPDDLQSTSGSVDSGPATNNEKITETAQMGVASTMQRVPSRGPNSAQWSGYGVPPESGYMDSFGPPRSYSPNPAIDPNLDGSYYQGTPTLLSNTTQETLLDRTLHNAPINEWVQGLPPQGDEAQEDDRVVTRSRG